MSARAPEPCREEEPFLDQEERARADRFIFTRHRIAYVEAHARMRSVLACYLDLPNSAITYERDPSGKPRLANPLAKLNFNLSHTGGLCALALTRKDLEVGIDVERVRPIEKLVADMHFSAAERADLDMLSDADWRRAFFRCWTRKEAVLKAEGAGLLTLLDSFDVSLLPGEPVELRAWRPEARLTRQWRLHHFEPAEDVVGAVAVSGDAVVTYFRIESRAASDRT